MIHKARNFQLNFYINHHPPKRTARTRSRPGAPLAAAQSPVSSRPLPRLIPLPPEPPHPERPGAAAAAAATR
ncbi:Translation initiation factor IF-2 [Frankliniella fusca]|uniref:Translation initiation factor IF-2 n=1 Tax=Frankliniella fusca TaxID=407009 RepID=A0AAE1I5V0_9NEOP|nr:Translation initiation factor IF-2 [Frankliniella fusca]